MLPIDLEWQLVIQKMVPHAESLQESRETFIATTFPVLHKSIIQCSAACSVLPAPEDRKDPEYIQIAQRLPLRDISRDPFCPRCCQDTLWFIQRLQLPPHQLGDLGHLNTGPIPIARLGGSLSRVYWTTLYAEKTRCSMPRFPGLNCLIVIAWYKMVQVSLFNAWLFQAAASKWPRRIDRQQHRSPPHGWPVEPRVIRHGIAMAMTSDCSGLWSQDISSQESLVGSFHPGYQTSNKL